MTSSINISFMTSPKAAGQGNCKKDYRSSAYNNYCAEVVDFDNEVFTINIEASSESEASEKANEFAFEMGIQTNYINIYIIF